MKTIKTRVLFVSLISSLFFLFSCNKEDKPVVEHTKEEKLLKVQKWIALELRVPEAEYLSKKWVYDTYDLLTVDLSDEKEVSDWIRKEELSLLCYYYSEKLMPNDEITRTFQFDENINTKFYISLYKKILGPKYKKRLKVNNMYYLKNTETLDVPYYLFPDKYCQYPDEKLADLLVKYYRDFRGLSKETIVRYENQARDIERKNRWRLIYENYSN